MDDSGGLEYSRHTRSERKEIEASQGVNGAVGIRNGQQCPNWVVDQNWVMSLLNQIPSSSGGTLSPSGPVRFKAPRNGFCDPALSDAIRRFQQMNGLNADGVVDPGGPTLRLMRVKSTDLRSQPGGGQDQAQLIDKIQELLDLLEVLNRQLAGTPEGVQTRQATLELERLLTQSGVARERRPVATQNYLAGAVVIIAVIVLVCGLVLYIITQTTVTSPEFQKGAKTLPDTIIKEFGIKIQRLQDLLSKLFFAAIFNIAQGVLAIENAAKELQKTAKKCEKPFLEFIDESSKFVVALRLSPDKLQLAARAKAWIQALFALVRCLGADGAILLELLGAPMAAGGSLIDQIIKLFLGNGFVPPLNLTLPNR